jgi:hypothetical protein
MNKNDFLSINNIQLLWDILLERLQIQSYNENIKYQIEKMYNEQLIHYYNNENLNYEVLLDMNKNFLVYFMNLFNKNIQSFIYKNEDIQGHRQNLFEKELAIKKADFDNTITAKKPPLIQFKENIEEDKIKEMDKLIAETIAKRNYEINQIHYEDNNNNNNNNPNQIIQEDNQSFHSSNKIYNKKYIKIQDIIKDSNLNNEIIELNNEIKNTNHSKHISWKPDLQTDYYEDKKLYEYESDNTNILNKFKKVPPTIDFLYQDNEIEKVNNNSIKDISFYLKKQEIIQQKLDLIISYFEKKENDK